MRPQYAVSRQEAGAPGTAWFRLRAQARPAICLRQFHTASFLRGICSNRTARSQSYANRGCWLCNIRLLVLGRCCWCHIRRALPIFLLRRGVVGGAAHFLKADDSPCQPSGRKTIAQHLSAGSAAEPNLVPAGTKEAARPRLPSSLPGLSGTPAANPALKCWAIFGRLWGTAPTRTDRGKKLRCARGLGGSSTLPRRSAAVTPQEREAGRERRSCWWPPCPADVSAA